MSESQITSREDGAPRRREGSPIKRGYIVGAIVIVFCLLTASISLRGSTTPHVTFTQAMESNETCQVYGALLKDSVTISRGMTNVRFRLKEKEAGTEIDMLYDRPNEPVAANFTTATEVRAVGTYDPVRRVFRVSQLYTKCPSKYESKGYKADKKDLPASGQTAPTK